MAGLLDYKCPNCGGQLEFDSNSQQLKCPFCDGIFDVETFNEGVEYAINSDVWNASDFMVYICESCGGQIMVDDKTAASSCPYCGANVVLKGNVEGQYKPKRIIPFKLDKEEAKKKYLQHLKGKRLLPSSFTSENVINEIKGVYVPFWIFDGDANAQIWYDATKVRTWSDKEYDYTETSVYKLFRAGRVSFNDVPVDASSRMDDNMMQSIEPFTANDLVDFNQNYLAGFYADKYDVTAEEAKRIADNRIVNSTSALFKSTTSSYSTCTPSSSQIRLSSGEQEYVMYPVYILNTTYKDKNYSFAMNGQTGKFIGDLPIDNAKKNLIFWSLFIGVTLAICLFQWFSIYAG